jgi:deoxyribonuclease IV
MLASLDGVPFVAETPGGKAAHARDIALLKDLRDAPRRAV